MGDDNTRGWGRARHGQAPLAISSDDRVPVLHAVHLLTLRCCLLPIVPAVNPSPAPPAAEFRSSPPSGPRQRPQPSSCRNHISASLQGTPTVAKRPIDELLSPHPASSANIALARKNNRIPWPSFWNTCDQWSTGWGLYLYKTCREKIVLPPCKLQ